MTDHDLIRLVANLSGHTATCRCGEEWHAPTPDAARNGWQLHRVALARQALEGGH